MFGDGVLEDELIVYSVEVDTVQSVPGPRISRTESHRQCRLASLCRASHSATHRKYAVAFKGLLHQERPLRL